MPFHKGQSGNPNGAPKKEQTFTKVFEDAVNRMVIELKDKEGNVTDEIKGKECVVQAYMDLAFNKKYPPQIKLKALETIIERIDGKARQTVSVDGDVNTNTPSVMDILDYKNMSKEKREALARAFGD